MGNGCYSQFIAHCLCCSFLHRGGLLTLCSSSSVGSFSWETVLHKLLQHESFPWAAALHELPHRGSFHGVQSFRNRLLQCGSPMGSQALLANLLQCGLLSPWVHRPARTLLQHGLPTGSQLPSGIHLLCCGASMGCRDRLPHHGLLHRLQGNPCFGAWSTSFPSFFTDPGVCRAISLTSSHSSLQLQLLWCSNFFTLLNTLSQRCYHHH